MLYLTYAGIITPTIAVIFPAKLRCTLPMQVLLLFNESISPRDTPYLPRYHPNKKAKLNTSFAFCFLCFCYQNFFFLHSHKLRMTKSTLTPMTAG